jgi:hypothetical protein
VWIPEVENAAWGARVLTVGVRSEITFASTCPQTSPNAPGSPTLADHAGTMKRLAPEVVDLGSVLGKVPELRDLPAFDVHDVDVA